MRKVAWTGSKFKPRKWQAEALPQIIKQIKGMQKPIVSAIMGSGKSVLIAELTWMAIDNLKPNRKIVITAPRQNLVSQLAKTIENRCGTENVGMFYAYEKTVDKRVIVCCNASVSNLVKKLQDNKVSLLIGDEVHGTESDSFKESYKMLSPTCAVGFTATPYRSNAKERLTLWDTVAYRYTAGDALSDGVIVPWKLVTWSGDKFAAKQVDAICHSLIQKSGYGPGIVSALDIQDAENYAQFLNDSGYKAKAIHSKIKKNQRQIMLEQLKTGELDMLVHVNLLSEGVDMPWLRWICLRRPVGARVRFVQEVGRVLRSHPDKEHAIIMDPHNLFSQHGLAYPEALGEILEVEPDDEELASLKLEPDQIQRVKKMPPAVAVGKIESWVTSILSIMKAAGFFNNRKKVTPFLSANTHYLNEDLLWRENPASVKQIRRVGIMFWTTKYLPKGSIRDNFKLMCQPERIGMFKKGTVSDILDIMEGLAVASYKQRKIKRYWTFPPNIPLPKLDIPMQGYLFAADKKEGSSTD